jgi:maltose O-acetyltransferase
MSEKPSRLVAKITLMSGWIWQDVQFAVWHFFVNRFAASTATPRPLRYYCYRLAKIHINTPSIAPGIFFTGPKVRIGKGSFVNFRCFFDSRMAAIEIGEECEIGMEVLFCGTTHQTGSRRHRCGVVVGKPVVVGDGCWIGARATILPGVTIGEGCIIGAGAVVASDCQKNGLYAGVPARRIKDLPE